MSAMRRWLCLQRVAIVLALAIGATSSAALDAPRVPKHRPDIVTDVPSPVQEGAALLLPPGSRSAPLPRPRPATEPEPETAAWADSLTSRFRAAAKITEADPPASSPSSASMQTLAAIDVLAPLPRPRPVEAATTLALVAPPPLPEALRAVEPVDSECLVRLRTLGVAFTEVAAIDPGGECNVDHPLNVTGLGAGIALEPEAILNCRTAESLARWMQDIVVPAALARLGEAPTKVVHGSTYVCRPRNNVAGAKLSEHAHANAVDIASIGFAKREPVAIGAGAGKPTADFEAEIRAGSCTYFTTVLGPGSNAAHAAHFHLDMAVRPGSYRLCELGAPSTVRAP